MTKPRSCKLLLTSSRKILQCYYCDSVTVLLSDNTWNDGSSVFTESTQESFHGKFNYKRLGLHNRLNGFSHIAELGVEQGRVKFMPSEPRSGPKRRCLRVMYELYELITIDLPIYVLLLTIYTVLLTIYDLLLTIYALLLIIYALLLTIYALLLTIYALLLTIYALLLTIYAQLLTIHTLLLTIFTLLLTIYALHNDMFCLSIVNQIWPRQLL